MADKGPLLVSLSGAFAVGETFAEIAAERSRLQALNKQLATESERLRELVGAFCVAAANLNENRREPYWMALMHIHDMASLRLAKAEDS